MELVVAKHSASALYEMSKITGIDKIELLDFGYQAIEIPELTFNGYELSAKKTKKRRDDWSYQNWDGDEE